MDGAVLITARGAGQSNSLGMSSNEREIPTPTGERLSQGWLAAACRFEGHASHERAGEPMDEPVAGMWQSAAALYVAHGRVAGIISPDDLAVPALWWSWPLASLRVETHGSRGLVKKRPETIVLHRDGATIVLGEIAKVWPGRGGREGRFQTGRELEFLKALSS